MNTAQEYDGSSWTSISAYPTAMDTPDIEGTTTASIASGGSTPTATAETNEWNVSTTVITAGAWASGGNYPSSVQGMGAAGTQTASVTAGGAGPTNLACEYDGSAWSTITNYPVSIRDVTGAGVQTAGLMISGYSPGNTEKTNSWNGSSWTGEGDLNNSTNRQLGGSAGIETAALFWGGDGGTPITAFESYNGSAWTALTAAPFGGNSSGCGTSTAALATPGPAVNTYEYGGSSWTAGGSTINRHEYGNTTGTQTASLIYSGGAPGSPAAYANNAEGYDGTAWSTRPSLAQSKQIIGHGSAGTQTAALATAGYLSTGATNTTEEFTGETTALNVKTLTQS